MYVMMGGSGIDGDEGPQERNNDIGSTSHFDLDLDLFDKMGDCEVILSLDLTSSIMIGCN